jgi:phosphoribosyl-ATP pyrophosphohydrolase
MSGDNVIPEKSNPGYHVTEIPRGIYGTSSKLLEEVLEIQDAERQNSKIMTLVEVADLYAAMLGYLEQNYPSISIDDVAKMATITRRAFENGHRTPRE